MLSKDPITIPNWTYDEVSVLEDEIEALEKENFELRRLLKAPDVGRQAETYHMAYERLMRQLRDIGWRWMPTITGHAFISPNRCYWVHFKFGEIRYAYWMDQTKLLNVDIRLMSVRNFVRTVTGVI